jgi:hypothetical protein
VTIAISLEAMACTMGAPEFAGPDICATDDLVASIQMQPTELTLPVGGTAQLTATLVSPYGGTFLLCPPQTFWVSANAAVANVVRGGVRAVKPGTTSISAHAGGKISSVFVTVTSAP